MDATLFSKFRLRILDLDDIIKKKNIQEFKPWYGNTADLSKRLLFNDE